MTTIDFWSKYNDGLQRTSIFVSLGDIGVQFFDCFYF